jgi:hypothetical protein
VQRACKLPASTPEELDARLDEVVRRGAPPAAPNAAEPAPPPAKSP